MNPVGVHPAKMELDCALDSSERDIDCLACGHTPREVWNRSSPVTIRILIDTHEVANCSHDLAPFRCACRFTDARVPFGMSSPRPPLTVTRPSLDECLNCRWLPAVVMKLNRQPKTLVIDGQL